MTKSRMASDVGDEDIPTHPCPLAPRRGGFYSPPRTQGVALGYNRVAPTGPGAGMKVTKGPINRRKLPVGSNINFA